MSEFRFQLTTFLLVALLGFGGYWAFATLDKGVTFSKDSTVATLPDSSSEPIDDPVVTLVDEEPTDTETPVEEVPAPTTPVELSAADQQTLRELEKLIADNINMKEGSFGTRVGTVQKFLNLYLETQTTVDNSYGPGTLARVKSFQEAEGLTADGLAGPSTYQKMIEVMKQG